MALPSNRRNKHTKSPEGRDPASDEDMKRLLNYFGLDEYTGLVPILKKLGSDTTSLNAFIVYAATFLFASGSISISLLSLKA